MCATQISINSRRKSVQVSLDIDSNPFSSPVCLEQNVLVKQLAIRNLLASHTREGCAFLRCEKKRRPHRQMRARAPAALRNYEQCMQRESQQ